MGKIPPPPLPIRTKLKSRKMPIIIFKPTTQKDPIRSKVTRQKERQRERKSEFVVFP